MDPAAAIANRALADQAWAQRRLAAHEGRSFAIAVGPLATAMRIAASGQLETMPAAGAAADLRLTLSPLDVPAFLAQPARWDEFVSVSGDAALAATLRDVAQTLPWFAERVLADALGPILGQRVADAGRRLLGLPEHAGQRIGESFVSYARDEAGLVAHPSALGRFAAETTALAERVDQAASRIEALAARIRPARSR